MSSLAPLALAAIFAAAAPPEAEASAPSGAVEQPSDPAGDDVEHPSESELEGAAARIGRALEGVSDQKLSAREIRSIVKATRPRAEPPAVAIIVPVSFFAMVGVVVGLVMVFRTRRETIRHETIRLALERGADIPTELLLPSNPRRSDVRRGLVLLFGGIGFSVAAAVSVVDEPVWSVGLFPIMIGVGYLAYAWLERRGLG